MSISQPISLHGRVGSAIIEDRDTRQRFPLTLTGDSSFDFTQKVSKLYGGNYNFPVAAENQDAESMLSLTVRQYDLAAFKYFSGQTGSGVTENTSGDTLGYTSSLTNVVGTSVFNATTGIASVAPKTGLSPIFSNRIYIKAVSATTVDVFMDSTVNGAYILTDEMKINSSPITIPGTGGTVDIPNANITLTGGSGAIAFTTNDIADLSSRPVNGYNFDVKIGEQGATFKEFSLYIMGQKQSNDRVRFLHFPRLKAEGFPIAFKENDFSSFDINLCALYDFSVGYVSKFVVVNR